MISYFGVRQSGHDQDKKIATDGLQVEQQVADVLRRILPEGIELPTEVQNAMPEEEEQDSYLDEDDDVKEEWEEEEQLEGVRN